jgi:hypothetical protein
MDWISLIGPALVAAGVSGAIAVMGLIVTTRTVRRLRADRLTSQKGPAFNRTTHGRNRLPLAGAEPTTERRGGRRNWCAFFYPAGAWRLSRVHCHDSSSVCKPARDEVTKRARAPVELQNP